MNLIFLISLPRAGSTLLQRLMMAHPAITSKSEPWIMLPFVYMLRPEGMVTDYNHRWAYEAVQDYIQSLPGGRASYEKLLREFLTRLYSLHGNNGETYFLDKTPRYYLIIRELAAIFPDARFIFLTRNPIQIISSIITTFSDNTLRNLHFYHIDLLKGFDKVAEGIRLLNERAVHVRYEDLVTDTPAALRRVFDFLDLAWEPAAIGTLDDAGLEGRLGDKWGTYAYHTVEDKSIHKWKTTLNERVRKMHIKRLIGQLDDKTVATHGYEKSALLKELDELKTRTTFLSAVDLGHILLSKLVKFSYLNLYRKRVKSWTKDVTIG